MGYVSVLKKMRSQLAEIEKEGDFINQVDLSFLIGIDIRTIRALRRQGALDSQTVRQNDVWICVESIKRYCARSK